MIIIDTREQKPLWNLDNPYTKKMKLDEGDYTTGELLNKAHAERKSGIDLYGSLVQGHERFVREIQRAIEKDLTFAIFVECSLKTFIAKRFKGGCRLKLRSEVLGRIITTFMNRYPIDFIFCKNREDLRTKMCMWFAEQMGEI